MFRSTLSFGPDVIISDSGSENQQDESEQDTDERKSNIIIGRASINVPDIRECNKILEARLIPKFVRNKQVSREGKIILNIVKSAVTSAEQLSWFPSFMKKVVALKETPSGDYVNRAHNKLNEEIINLIKLLDEGLAEIQKQSIISEDSFDSYISYEVTDMEGFVFNDSKTELKASYATQMILEYFRENPRNYLEVRKSSDAQSVYLKRFVGFLKKFQDCIHHRLLLTAVEKFNESNLHHELWLRTKEHELRIIQIQEEIAEFQKSHEIKLQKKLDVVRFLKLEVMGEEAIVLNGLKKLLEKSAKNRVAQDGSQWDTDTELQLEVKRTAKLFHEVHKRNLKAESKVREVKNFETSELYLLCQKYDTVMEEREVSILDINEEIEEQRNIINDLETELYRMKPEYDDIMMVQYLAIEMERMAAELEYKRDRAARLIQCFWRRWHYLRMKKLEEEFNEELMQGGKKDKKKKKSKKKKGDETDEENEEGEEKAVKKNKKGAGKGKKKGKKEKEKVEENILEEAVEDEFVYEEDEEGDN